MGRRLDHQVTDRLFRPDDTVALKRGAGVDPDDELLVTRLLRIGQVGDRTAPTCCASDAPCRL